MFFSHDKTHFETIPYYAEIYYANQTICLWTPPADNHIPAGQIYLPFQFQIPFNAPPTFERNKGFIRYWLKAKIDRPWAIDDKSTFGFTVLPFFDLNTLPYAGFPLMRDTNREVGICCCKHGRLLVRLVVAKSGFVPGEHIPIKVEIQNNTSKAVKQVKIQVLQHAHFTANRHAHSFHFHYSYNRHPDVMTKHKDDKIVSKKTEVDRTGNWTFEDSVQIPPVVPSFNLCEIIQVNYTLCVS